jgi:hypothetical protein
VADTDEDGNDDDANEDTDQASAFMLRLGAALEVAGAFDKVGSDVSPRMLASLVSASLHFALPD